MSISEKEIRHIANLSKLGIEDKEVRFYAEEISAILDYMKKLEKVNIPDSKQLSGIEQKKQQNVRQDTFLLFSARSFADVLMDMTNKTKDGFVKIKQVLTK